MRGFAAISLSLSFSNQSKAGCEKFCIETVEHHRRRSTPSDPIPPAGECRGTTPSRMRTTTACCAPTSPAWWRRWRPRGSAQPTSPLHVRAVESGATARPPPGDALKQTPEMHHTSRGCNRPSPLKLCEPRCARPSRRGHQAARNLWVDPCRGHRRRGLSDAVPRSNEADHPPRCASNGCQSLPDLRERWHPTRAWPHSQRRWIRRAPAHVSLGDDRRPPPGLRATVPELGARGNLSGIASAAFLALNVSQAAGVVLIAPHLSATDGLLPHFRGARSCWWDDQRPVSPGKVPAHTHTLTLRMFCGTAVHICDVVSSIPAAAWN